MAISENLKPKEVEYLKYLKNKGINVQDSYTRLENARNQGLFGDKTTENVQTELVKTEEKKVKPFSLKGFYEYGIKPSAKQLGGLISGTAKKTGEIAKGGIKRIEEAGVGLAEGELDIDEAFARGAAGALQTFWSPLGGVLGQTIEETGKVIPEDFKQAMINKITPTAKDVKYWWDSQTPEQQKELVNIGVGLELLLEFTGAGGIEKATKKTLKEIGQTGKEIIKKTPEIVEKGVQKVTTTSKIKNILEEAKKRIETGPQQFKGVVGQEPVISGITKEVPKKVIKETEKKITSLNKAFTPLQRVRDGKVVRPQEVIDNQWTKIIDDFDKKGIHPTNMKEFRDEMIKGQQNIYKVIDPAIEKSNVKINLTDTLNSVRKNIPENAEAFSKNQVKQIDNIINSVLSDSRYQNMNMKKLEELKQFINSVTDYNATGQDKVLNNFLKDLSYKIGDLQDNVLGQIEGQSTIKDLKRTYGAYSDMLGDVNKAIIKYERKAPVGLFSGLGRIAGVGNLIESAIKGDVKGAIKGGAQIVTGEVIKNINDANNIIKRTFKKVGETFRGTPKPLKIKKQVLALPEGKTINAPKTKILPGNKPLKLKLQNQNELQLLKRQKKKVIEKPKTTKPLQKKSEIKKETPKTVKVWIKSKFSDKGAYKDLPIIRKVENETLYQGSKPGENRQFWTKNKEYAKQFGDVKEKTGTFYQVDNGNRVTEVYVEANNRYLQYKK